MCEYGVDYAVWCHLVGAGEHLARPDAGCVNMVWIMPYGVISSVQGSTWPGGMRDAGRECEIFTHLDTISTLGF